MSKERYNCYWIVSFLPTRTEVMITKRDTNELMFQDLSADINKSFNSVEQYLTDKGIKIFNYDTYDHRITLNFCGKGYTNE